MEIKVNSQMQIELLRWMLEDVRNETLKGIEHLTKEQLFQTPIEGEYPIGAYLMHLAELDIYQLELVSGKEQPEDLKKKSYFDKWYDAAWLDPDGKAAPPEEPIEISKYLETISEARKNLLDYVSSLKDSALEDEIVIKGKSRDIKFTKKFMIYHIIEHEAHHRGQMFLLIRKAGWNKNKKN